MYRSRRGIRPAFPVICLAFLYPVCAFGQPAEGEEEDLPELPATATKPATATTRPIPTKIPDLMKAADEAIAERNYPYAERLLRHVLRKRPGYENAVLNLSDVLAERGQKALALETLEEFIQETLQGRSSWQAHLKAGALYQESGFNSLAKARLHHAETINPADARIYAFLARTYDATGQKEKALTYATKAARADPNQISYQVQLARAYLENRKFGEADQAARKALTLAEARLEKNPGRVELLQELQVQMNVLQQVLMRHVQASPKDGSLRFELSKLIRRRTKVEEGLWHHLALQHIITADELSPNNADILLEKATLFRLLYNYEEALKAYKQVLAIRSANEEANKWVPLLEERLAKLKKAAGEEEKPEK